MSTLADRMRLALSRVNGGTQAGLAKACHVSTASVNGWFSGKTSTLKADSARRAAAYLCCSRDWLETGRGSPDLTAAPFNRGGIRQPLTANDITLSYAGHPKTLERVAIMGVIDTLQAGSAAAELSPAGEGGLVDSYSDDPDAFALKIHGDDLYPAVRHGSCIVVEPLGRPMPGELVVIETDRALWSVRELVAVRDDSITVLHPRTGERITMAASSVNRLLPVAAVVAASKWRAQ